MGRALYSQTFNPVIRDPSPTQYDKWSIHKPLDPDSEEFFQEAQYEAVLPEPITIDTSARNDGRMFVNNNDADHPTRSSRVRISSEDPTSIVSMSNSMNLNSVPHDLPDMDAPSIPTSPPPVSLPALDFSGDMDSPRPSPSPMAGDSDSEDPMRLFAGFLNEYRTARRHGDPGPHLNVSEILRQLDQQWRRELTEAQSTAEPEPYRPQRYLPPLSYPSSGPSSSGSSSRADSPSSSMFFPSPPNDTLPSPPPMSRELGGFPPHDLPFQFDEDLERIEHELEMDSVEEITDPEPEYVSSIPISETHTPSHAIYIHHRTPSAGFGYDIGLDMSPPPSVSPRLYNWSFGRTESADTHTRYGSVSGSPVNFGRRVGGIRITEGRI